MTPLPLSSLLSLSWLLRKYLDLLGNLNLLPVASTHFLLRWLNPLSHFTDINYSSLISGCSDLVFSLTNNDLFVSWGPEGQYVGVDSNADSNVIRSFTSLLSNTKVGNDTKGMLSDDTVNKGRVRLWTEPGKLGLVRWRLPNLWLTLQVESMRLWRGYCQMSILNSERYRGDGI